MTTPDDQDEPSDLAFSEAFDLDAASRAGANYCANVSSRRTIRDALAGVALVVGVHVCLAQLVLGDDPHAQSDVGDRIFAIIEAFALGSPENEAAVLNTLGGALARPEASRLDAFVTLLCADDEYGAGRDVDQHKFGIYMACLAAQAARRPKASHRALDADVGLSPLEDLSTARARLAYLADTAAHVRMRRYQALLQAKRARQRIAEKERREAEARAEIERRRLAWRADHQGVPEIFTEERIAAHNAAHPDDPWTASVGKYTGRPTGMLTDRCCFASCPTRFARFPPGGLQKHLYDGQCIPGFHAACTQAYEAVILGTSTSNRKPVIDAFEAEVVRQLETRARSVAAEKTVSRATVQAVPPSATPSIAICRHTDKIDAVYDSIAQAHAHD